MKFTEVERMLAERNTFTVKLIDHVDRGRVRTQNTCSQIGANLRRSDWPTQKIVQKQVVSNQT